MSPMSWFGDRTPKWFTIRESYFVATDGPEAVSDNFSPSTQDPFLPVYRLLSLYIHLRWNGSAIHILTVLPDFLLILQQRLMPRPNSTKCSC